MRIRFSTLSRPLSHLVVLFAINAHAAPYADDVQVPPKSTSIQHSHHASPKVISINLTSENDGWEDSADSSSVAGSSLNEAIHNNGNHEETVASNYARYDQDDRHCRTGLKIEDQDLTYKNALTEEEVKPELPGKEIDYEINLHSSTHHLIRGRADSDIGKMLFKSRLMPSNEVKLSLKLKQRETDDVELVAYFDLANFTMELDGSNSVLNKEHKLLMKTTTKHLQSKFEEQYEDYDFPEHSLMLVQMLSYWSVSPEGYAHEKQTIVSQ